jgi:protein-tyrosine phosphatase
VGEIMIDIHSHLIFGVDDGSSCLEESIRMIEAAYKYNICTIIATPHFQNGIFNNDGVLEKFELLVNKAADYHIDIRLGNEVFADDEILNITKAKKNINFGNSQYLLIELPYSASFEYIAKLIYKIAAANIKIIIAHPERNRNIIRNFYEFIKLIRTANCQVQLDAGSIIGVYGAFVKEFARQLLKMKMVDFMASNAHCSSDYMTIFPAAVQKIYRLCDEEYAIKLLESNAHEIITVDGSISNYGREIG